MFTRILFTGLLCIGILSCLSEEEEVLTALKISGILDRWEIQSRIVNNIADLTAHCCVFIEFIEDDNETDLRGIFESEGPGFQTDGIFTIFPQDSILFLEFENMQRAYLYKLEGELLELKFDDQGFIVEEEYVRR